MSQPEATQGDLSDENTIIVDGEASLECTEVIDLDDEELSEDEGAFIDDPSTWPDEDWGRRHQEQCDDPGCMCWQRSGHLAASDSGLCQLFIDEGPNLARMKLQGQAAVTLKMSLMLGHKGKDLALTVGGVAPWWLNAPGVLLYCKFVGKVLRISRDSDEEEFVSKNELLVQDSSFLKVYNRHFVEYLLGFE
jgi:hypothetical protein